MGFRYARVQGGGAGGSGNHRLGGQQPRCAQRRLFLLQRKAIEAPPIELIQFVDNEVKKVPSDLFTTSILEVCF